MKDGWKEAGREAAEAEARDRESKTRTPHKVVGKKQYIYIFPNNVSTLRGLDSRG